MVMEPDQKTPAEKNIRTTLLLMGLFSLASLYPLWLVDYFPSVDGPAHVALTHIWMNIDLPDFGLYREYYQSGSLNSPNMLIYFLLYGLMKVFPPFIAEKILLSLFVVGLPWSIWYMTTSKDREQGTVALLSFPLVYNYITYFGFYNFLFGALLFCLTLGYWLRFRSSSNHVRLHYFHLSVLLTAAYFTHISSIAFILLSIAVLFAVEILQSLFGTEYRHASEHHVSNELTLNSQLLFFLIAASPAALLATWSVFRIFRILP